MMEAKNYLEQAFFLDDEVDRLLAERQGVYNTLFKAGLTDTETKSKQSKLDEYNKAVDTKIDELVELKLEFSKCIDQVPKQKLKTLLTKRYIELKSYEEIAQEMGYDYSWITRLHTQALEAVEETEFFKSLN